MPGPNVAITYCSTLVDQWVRLGVRHAVVSPGSRSTPLALACANHPELITHVHHDERSAAFVALGVGRATSIPALLVTTSGTAATELHPAVVEAHQAFVPMLVCTADRPPELQGVGAPQTIRQTHLYGDAVRWFVEPGPPSDDDRGGWRYLATDAYLAAIGAPSGRAPGPVHLNLAFREPLVGDGGELPPTIDVDVAPHAIWGLLEEQLGGIARSMRGRRGVIVAGDRATIDDPERELVLDVAEALGWPVLADHLSGLRVDHPAVVVGVDALLRDPELATALRPEFALRLGGLLASRVVNEWLAASGAVHVGIDRWGAVPDPDHLLAHRFPADVSTVCRQFLGIDGLAAPADWLPTWRRASAAAAEAIADTAGGDVAVARAVVRAVPDGGTLVVSSSMPIRDVEWYAGPAAGIRVVSNRGANGIDGVTSTAVGVALGDGTHTVCLIGDVAFLHDTNGLLGLAARRAPLAVVVVDNDGGGIFSFLPQATALDPTRYEQLFGTPHGVDIAALVAAHGLPCVTAPDADAVTAALAEWAAEPMPLIVVVPSDRSSNVEVHRAVHDAVAAAGRRAVSLGEGATGE